MSPSPGDAPYTLRHLEQMLGLSKHVISGLVNAGYVVPARGPRNDFRFSFQDVVLLRTAYHLRAANIPPRRLLNSLKQLRARLPATMPLSGLRITALGNEVAVRDGAAGGTPWEPQSGQLLMDFDVAPSAGSVSFLQRVPARSAADWFTQGEGLEGTDPAAAEAAYREALRVAPDHVHAYVNLGALLCEAGRCDEAVALYERATGVAPDSPLLHFNAAIALEDQHRDLDALRSYERCLALAPDLDDAHYNAARLCEKLGDAQGTLRHYSAFRRLQMAAAEET